MFKSEKRLPNFLNRNKGVKKSSNFHQHILGLTLPNCLERIINVTSSPSSTLLSINFKNGIRPRRISILDSIKLLLLLNLLMALLISVAIAVAIDLLLPHMVLAAFCHPGVHYHHSLTHRHQG
ncbi:hypothetical protein DERP_010012 [Dermatophagoides pteronyssinus]|uniref:Uncharacterized protein n=1 Tax=Dermatophagoides pteronyssinus TaxID=6956 RepID=A0ABQ8J261_DERPT|nr:hypothetical protein DERP_010012 [Dermatophagoides pteronyssinus]